MRWLALLLLCCQVSGQVVYDNLAHATDTFLDITQEVVGTLELADVVQIDRPAHVQSITFETYQTGLASARVDIYAISEAGQPAALLWQSDQVQLPTGLGLTTVQLGMDLPETFAVGLVFSGVTRDKSVGPTLYDPPAIGASTAGYWSRVWEEWRYNEFADGPADFGLAITAVPEPRQFGLAMALAGAVAGIVLAKRKAIP